MTLRGLRVTPMHGGHGVLATKRWEADSVLGRYEGQVISGEENLRRYPHNEAQYLLGPVETAGKPPFFIDASDPLGSALMDKVHQLHRF